jgi:lipopolysaccharide transport system permease protein
MTTVSRGDRSDSANPEATAVASGPVTDSQTAPALSERSALHCEGTPRVEPGPALVRHEALAPGELSAEAFPRAEAQAAPATSVTNDRPVTEAHAHREDAASLETSQYSIPSRPANSSHGQLARWREILYMLVLRDLKARSKQAFLGYFWILIQPLLVTGVFSVLVQQVLGRGDLSDVPYPVFLMAGVIPWQFFANSLNESSESLVKNVDLVRQVYFPREILAIYPVFARLIDVVIGCVALAVFLVVWHVPVSGWVVVLPVIVLEEMLFAAAIGMLLSAANVGWRDISRGLPLVLFLMMYAVPVLYPPERVPPGLRPLFGLNPIGYLIDAFRTSVIGPGSPDFVVLAVLGALGIGALVLAQRVFSYFDGVLADVI